MRTKLLGLPLAGLLLVGGATAVLAQSGAAGAITGAATRATTLLGEVLDDLVGDGTIERSQADAILEAVDERRTELREQAEALRQQMRTFLQDGTLSADELAQLPEDHPLRNLDQFLEDGQLTRDELRQLRTLGPGRGSGFRFGPGHHGPWGEAPAPDDSGDDGAEGSSTSF